MSFGIPYTKNPLMEGFTENYFETKDHVRIRYLHKGSGMPLILLHGYSDNADCWLLNAPAFAKGYSVYALDLRGHGYSVASHGARISRLASDLNEFIEFLDVPKVNLLGWSMGCSVIWSYIDLFGQDAINKAIFDDEPPVLVSSPYDSLDEVLTCGSNRMDPWYLSSAIYEGGFSWYEGSPFFRAFPACFHRGVLVYSEEEMADIPDGYLEKISLRPTPPILGSDENGKFPFMANLLKDHLLLDWRDLFPTITVPVMYLTGDVSHATTLECGEWMRATMQNCTWVRFSKEEFGNHDFLQTAYKKFNRVVLEFLKQQS
jgi:pimeloyl-ACP methyl ester carboxylesterase